MPRCGSTFARREIERWVDLVDLERDVVDADEARMGHGEPPGRSGKDEMAVAELVPVVAVLDRSLVGALEELVAASRPQHLEMGGLGLVPAGEQTVDGPQSALGRHDQIRPALAGREAAAGLGDGLERADHCGANGDHSPAPAVDDVGKLRRSTSCCDPKGASGELHNLFPVNRSFLKGRNGGVGLLATPGLVAVI
jgi:hypothetical protein